MIDTASNSSDEEEPPTSGLALHRRTPWSLVGLQLLNDRHDSAKHHPGSPCGDVISPTCNFPDHSSKSSSYWLNSCRIRRSLRGSKSARAGSACFTRRRNGIRGAYLEYGDRREPVSGIKIDASRSARAIRQKTPSLSWSSTTPSKAVSTSIQPIRWSPVTFRDGSRLNAILPPVGKRWRSRRLAYSFLGAWRATGSRNRFV